jgi:aminocarboxymuconate-semialdehyde decarboxylase
MPVIDLHHHIVIPEAAELARKEQAGRPQHADTFDGFTPPVSMEYNKAQAAHLGPKFFDVAEKRRDLKRDRIDMAVVSPHPGGFHYWATGPAGDEIVRLTNDGIAAYCKATPEIFRGLGIVPLQNGGRAAAAELERALGLGLKGVAIGTTVNARPLDDADFEPFWAAAGRSGALVLLHPDFAAFQPLFPYYLVNIIGNPLATTTTVTRLILSGHFERHRGIRLLAVHAGGYLPFARGRLDHGWTVRPETKVHTPKPPSAYFEGLYFDAITFYGPALRYMVETLGADRIVLGTDYPFDMMLPDPVGFVEGAGLGAEARGKILGANAARLLGL